MCIDIRLRLLLSHEQKTDGLDLCQGLYFHFFFNGRWLVRPCDEFAKPSETMSLNSRFCRPEMPRSEKKLKKQ